MLRAVAALDRWPLGPLEVGHPIAIDVDRVGPVCARKIRRRIAHLREAEGSAGRAVIAIEGRGIAPTREIKVRLPVTVAIEHS